MQRGRPRLGTVRPMLTLVLTMGRVGSTATFRALKEVDGVEAFHLHHLAKESLARWAGKALSRHGEDTLRVRKRLVASPDERVKVLSLVRDVVPRNLSVGFARFRKAVGNDPDKMVEMLDQADFLAALWRRVDWRLPFTWFDIEIRDQMSIDVFATPFPDDGIAIHRSGRFDLLVMRSDVDNREKSAAISAFLGQPIVFKQMSVATQEGGSLRSTYDAFSATSRWGREDLREMGQSRVMRHFFAVTDPDRYAADWLAKLKR